MFILFYILRFDFSSVSFNLYFIAYEKLYIIKWNNKIILNYNEEDYEWHLLYVKEVCFSYPMNKNKNISFNNKKLAKQTTPKEHSLLYFLYLMKST